MRRWFGGVLWFAMLCLVGCGEGGLTEVIREVNACWSEDGQSILLAESSYKTSNPSEPYYNAASGKEWQVVLREAKVQGEVLQKGKELFRWVEEAQPGLTLQHHPMYWLKLKARLISMIGARPFLLNLEVGHASFGKRIILRPSDEVLLKFVKKDELAGFSARSPAPSPDGGVVGVFYSYAYQPSGGSPFSMEHLHVMSFFKSADGAHLRSVALNWPDKEVDPHLTPPLPITKQKVYFLWKADSSGVFVLDRKRAKFIPVAGGEGTSVSEVPSQALQTKGGVVSPQGRLLDVVETGNQAVVQVRQASGWISFEKLVMIPQGTEKYSVGAGG